MKDQKFIWFQLVFKTFIPFLTFPQLGNKKISPEND